MSNDVFIISGTLGAGKSTLSRQINSKLGYALIDGDALFNPLENTPNLSWDDRLQITWSNIANITTEYLKNNLNVVIDFVVESELAWFLEQLESYHPKVKYCQLIADETTLTSRLSARDGSTQYLIRSLKLLSRIKDDSTIRKFLVDTSKMSERDVFETFLRKDQYFI